MIPAPADVGAIPIDHETGAVESHVTISNSGCTSEYANGRNPVVPALDQLFSGTPALRPSLIIVSIEDADAIADLLCRGLVPIRIWIWARVWILIWIRSAIHRTTGLTNDMQWVRLS